MIETKVAAQMIEALRIGKPPQRGVQHYSIGNEKLIDGIKKRHLSGIADRGIIRFINGSWGAGKTHFFRLLREIAFENGCLVSSVELNVNDASLNKFESVFYAIIRNVATPSSYGENAASEAAPFGSVVRESLSYLAAGRHEHRGEIQRGDYDRAVHALMADHSIDIDFKKMIQHYWETFLPESPDPVVQAQTRDEILQWFSGEGTIGGYRKRFGVSKMVSRDNARLMLQSLSGFVRLSGYRGLVILFDEAEQAYSIMRKSALKDAHNNLLSLINNIESLSGLFLIYATTPDFFTDPKHGIVIYGALSGRIGKPEQREPRALDVIWNLDEVEPALPDYQAVAKKIRGIYAEAYPDAAHELPAELTVEGFVSELFDQHPSLAPVRFWRVLVTALITYFDDCLEGEVSTTEEIYEDVMDRLRED